MTTPASKYGIRLSDEQMDIITPVAVAEGWGLFCESQHDDLYHIERDDEAGVFVDDEAAIEFIQRRAVEGSGMHALALAAHNSVHKQDPDSPEAQMSQDDLDALHAEGFHQWAEAETLGFPADQPLLSTSTRQGFLPLLSEHMEYIDSMAQREGWLLCEKFGGSYDGKYLIERFDEDDRFASDAEAEAFVRKHAEAGSEYHQMALQAHNKPAGEVIDKSQVKVTLTLEVDYRLNGTGLAAIHKLLRENFEEVIHNEGLAEHLAAEVKDWSIKIN